MKATNNKSRRLQAINAAEHRANVEAAAAADRHARDFSRMFAITSSLEDLAPTASYLEDLAKKGS
jgi:hypothetical protein